MWVGLCDNSQVLEPFFFDGNVTGNSYLKVINMEIFPLLVLFPHQFQGGQFQRLMGTGWCTRATELRRTVNCVFQSSIVAPSSDTEWPPRSSVLMCDFFLWGYIKSRPPPNLNKLGGKYLQSLTI